MDRPFNMHVLCLYMKYMHERWKMVHYSSITVFNHIFKFSLYNKLVYIFKTEYENENFTPKIIKNDQIF